MRSRTHTISISLDCFRLNFKRSDIQSDYIIFYAALMIKEKKIVCYSAFGYVIRLTEERKKNNNGQHVFIETKDLN